MNEIEQQSRDLFYSEASRYNIPADTQSMIIASATTWRERYELLTSYLHDKAR